MFCELKAAMRAVHAAPEPVRARALAALQEMAQVDYDRVVKEIRPRLGAKDKVEEVRAVVLPIENYLEAPRILAELNRLIDRSEVDEIKTRMRAVQAKYLRDFLVLADPAFATTTTTFGRLVARGFDVSMESTVDDPW